MSIKKQYAEIIAFLEENKNKKISTILEEAKAMCESKKATKNFRINVDGEVTEIYCYYHKQWEVLADVEYGTKKHSASGYNSMCKAGVNQWSKQQREAKKAREELLLAVAKHEVAPEDIETKMAGIEATRVAIVDETA